MPTPPTAPADTSKAKQLSEGLYRNILLEPGCTLTPAQMHLVLAARHELERVDLLKESARQFLKTFQEYDNCYDWDKVGQLEKLLRQQRAQLTALLSETEAQP